MGGAARDQCSLSWAFLLVPRTRPGEGLECPTYLTTCTALTWRTVPSSSSCAAPLNGCRGSSKLCCRRHGRHKGTQASVIASLAYVIYAVADSIGSINVASSASAFELLTSSIPAIVAESPSEQASDTRRLPPRSATARIAAPTGTPACDRGLPRRNHSAR